MRAFVFAAAVLAATPTLAQTPDVAPIVAAERAFAADFPAMGLAGSFLKWGRSDAILINGGRAQPIDKVFEGAPLTRQPGEPLIEWHPTFAGVARSGEMGFTTGPAARDQEGYGHYFTVWKRQADGQWRWVYDGGSNASPAGQPGRDSEPRILPVARVGSASPEAAMTEVRAAEAGLAAAAAVDQKAAHLSVLAADGRLYVAPLPPAEGPEAFATALDGWPARFEFGHGRRRRLGRRRHGLDVRPGGLDPRRTVAHRPLYAAVAEAARGLAADHGPADSGPDRPAPSPRGMSRPICHP